ncbi:MULTISPECIES: winged helix-turn-helix domain-containing protein [unclassified Streptomyces]|uniref:winged helix-turn-helix domain-containing protein n=1 Tax=unclassified Streptomyces TaxID=2593676 RepID=UPI000DAC2A89|nr:MULTISPECIES: transcriptional regulator [unclassified Streptomyces]PZT77176.1 transcriptional regulator [Streptomyces sp. AC1-42W]PZT78872.1 transcriptional regulator [Streptomyces sp. AC1-42T]
MGTPFEELAGLDRLIHEPGRLAIVSALAACDSADFLFLHRVTGLSRGNLSAHLTVLEKAEVVRVTKGFSGKRPRTWVELTPHGRQAVAGYWEGMGRLRGMVAEWRRESEAE